MAVYHPPHASRIGRRVISEAARQSIAEAARLLYGDAPGLRGEDALAERERLRVAAESADQVQGELPLGGRR